MEENKESEKKQVNTEELKNETVNTVNEVKETIKNVNIKKDTVATTNFIKEIFTNPLEKIKEISADDSNKYLKYAIIILAVWVIAIVIKGIFAASGIWKFSIAWKALLGIIKSAIAPLLGVLVTSVIIMMFSKNNKKKLTTIITAVTTAQIPVVIADVLGLLIIISSSMSKLLTPFTGFCSTISIILTYFTAKAILGTEKNSEFLKKFVLIEACYYVAYFVLTFLEIYI